MDIDGLPLIGSGVDFTQVEALNQKRILAFINHFITSTVSFLNKFSRSCEIRLQECESRIQKLEAAILILESKLSSIPGLEEAKMQIQEPINVNVEIQESVNVNVQIQESIKVNNVVPNESSSSMPEVQQNRDEPANSPNMIPINEDPTLKRFFRMLQFGVPEPAVRLKMTQEGIDPDLLKNPNQLVPAQTKTEAKLSDSEESSEPGE